MHPSQIEAALEAGYAAGKAASGGKNADYIPYLASVPSDLFGLVITTAGGQTWARGDVDHAFAIESISKVFSLALALETHGIDQVRTKIGASATGMPFNSVMALELHDGRPLSPLVNAGAIATTSLAPGATAEEQWSSILAMQSAFAGHAIALGDEVYASEQATNFHNRAIAWLLYDRGYCYCDPMQAVDVYTRQCSTLVTCRDLAAMGATLAAGGIHPETGKRVIAREHVSPILAEMMMEGLYEASGEWAFNVELPGKSGVGGGLLAIAPGKLAIAAFAPPLDEAGNSVAGQAAIAAVARQLGLSVFAA